MLFFIILSINRSFGRIRDFVFDFLDFFRIEMIRQILAEHDIDAVVMNKQDSSYRFGQIELYTHQDREADALQVIEEMGNIDELPEE